MKELGNKIKMTFQKIGNNIKTTLAKTEKNLQTESGKKKLVVVLICVLGVFLVLSGVTQIYNNVKTVSLECKYESGVYDYSTLKIEEVITNEFVKDKRTKVIQKSIYTILNKDKDTLDSMKEDKKSYVATFDDIKGAKATYKVKGYKITTTVTYSLNKMDSDKLTDLQMSEDTTYDEIKSYYESYGYTCK